MDKSKEHMQILTELNETYVKKNADYGNSFDNSLDKHGLVAAAVRLGDKMSRLDSLVGGKKAQVLDESIEDTLLDMANYAVMSVMWLRNKELKSGITGDQMDLMLRFGGMESLYPSDKAEKFAENWTAMQATRLGVDQIDYRGGLVKGSENS